MSIGPGQRAFARMPLHRVLHRDLARHREHAALARGVRNLRCRGTHERDERRGVDDRAAARIDHRRDSVLAAEPYTLEVYVHDPVPGRDFRLRDAPVVRGEDARVVVEHVQCAVRVDGEAHHGGGVVFVGHVGRDEGGVAARLRDRPDGGSARVLHCVDRDDARALAREQKRCGAPHAVARSGDERDLALQSRRHRRLRSPTRGSPVPILLTRLLRTAVCCRGSAARGTSSRPGAGHRPRGDRRDVRVDRPRVVPANGAEVALLRRDLGAANPGN